MFPSWTACSTSVMRALGVVAVLACGLPCTGGFVVPSKALLCWPPRTVTATFCLETLAEEDKAGPLAGEFWEQFCEEAEAEAAEYGLEVEDIAFKRGTLSVLVRGGLDELQQINSALSSFLDANEGEVFGRCFSALVQQMAAMLSLSCTCDRPALGSSVATAMARRSQMACSMVCHPSCLRSPRLDFHPACRQTWISALSRAST